MYTFAQLDKLLSQSTKGILTDASNFTELEHDAAVMVADTAGIDVSSTPDEWMKVPFAWILDYLTSNRISGLSSDGAAIYKQQFDLAIKMLSTRAVKKTNATSHVGEIDDPYITY